MTVQSKDVSPLARKSCTACHQTYPIKEGFYRDPRGADGHLSRCKRCIIAYQKEHASRDREKYLRQKRAEAKRNHRPRRNRLLVKLYGITLAQYEAMEEKQGGACAICLGPQVGRRSKYLCVDHCHDTGKVRGLLCDKCNKGIGLLNHDQDTLIAAMRYLAVQ